ncbi:MAG: hypothetical protein BKP49_07810 [Treponema sp. CETP13]|nr:MAG: hypothetical protein BKP49_07810 [Treponema sp. CETP13]
MEKITVLMSTYNGEKYLKEQLDSILAQEDVNINLIIRDDGSSDKTLEILTEYSKKHTNITYYCGENLKPAKSFLELMTKEFDSEYYALADQDDIWDSDKLKCGIDKLKTLDNTKPNLYFSNLRIVNQDNVFFQNAHKKQIIPNKYVALATPIVTGCTIIYNKKAKEILKDHIPTSNLMHDSWLYLICIFFGQVIYDFIPHINYRQHENNVIGMAIKKNKLCFFLDKIKEISHDNNEPRYNNAIAFLESFKLQLQQKDIQYISLITNYKQSFKNKLLLIFNRKIKINSLLGDFKFRLKIILENI